MTPQLKSASLSPTSGGAGETAWPRAAGDRLESIDRLRGIIMIVMALDHVSFMVGRFHAQEMWAGVWTRYTSALPFLTRFVTHFCAPGFYFLMGVGISLLANSRSKQGWSAGRISRFLATRGLLLVLVSQVVELPAWLIGLFTGPRTVATSPDDMIPGMASPRTVFTVLVGLGLSMMLSAVFIRFRYAVWAGLAAASLLATALLTPGPESFSTPYSFLSSLLLVSRWSHGVWIQYPVIPWFGVTALGVLLGRWILADRAAAFRSLPWIGLTALLAAVLLRANGGFGNFRAPRDGTWIEFMNFIKYPPSPVFTLFMLGGNLLMLALLEKSGTRMKHFGRVFSVFGQAPLAYYLAHLWLFALIGAAFFRHGASYAEVYAVWLTGLIPLFFLTRRYRDFKLSKPADSIWRFF